MPWSATITETGHRVPVRRLFVYGTLQPHADTPIARWLESRTLRSAPARAPGQLFALPDSQGWYPGWRAAANGSVAGTLLTTCLSAADLSRLDAYEGRDYRRVTVRVRVERPFGEGLVAAQGWRWARKRPATAVPVPGGDFLDWLAMIGDSAFR